MFLRHKYDRTGECYFRGNEAEEAFKAFILTKPGWNYQETDASQDINGHEDLVIFNDTKRFTVDVKAKKKISRSDTDPSDTHTWIEAHGVNPGNDGYILGGHADYIVFDTGISWLFVKRTRLVTFVKDIKKSIKEGRNKIVYSTREAQKELNNGRYSIYQRAGRNDQIILVKIEDLRKFSDWEWPKC